MLRLLISIKHSQYIAMTTSSGGDGINFMRVLNIKFYDEFGTSILLLAIFISLFDNFGPCKFFHYTVRPQKSWIVQFCSLIFPKSKILGTETENYPCF